MADQEQGEQGELMLLVAAIASQNYHFSGPDLTPRDLAQWQTLRKQVHYRQEARREHFRFRKDPAGYLRTLEEQLSPHEGLHHCSFTLPEKTETTLLLPAPVDHLDSDCPARHD